MGALIKLALVLAVLGLFAIGSWAATDFVFHETGGEAFCTGCHTMEPVAVAYRQDVHGGNNAGGLKAQCVDCHLSHSDPLAYVYTKAKFGLNDVYSQYFTDLSAIDWHAMREHREDYTFDSGCLQCHAALENAPRDDNKAFVAHKPYFLGNTEKQCVSCHMHVGHKDLGLVLDTHFEKEGGT